MDRILVCGLTSNLGGIEKVILNFYQFMNKEKYALDFLCLGMKKLVFIKNLKKFLSMKLIIIIFQNQVIIHFSLEKN